MCGGFALIVDQSILARAFEAELPFELQPRYNIAPTQMHPILHAGRNGDRRWLEARWGLIPHWAKDERMGARMINARGETVAEKPSFRSAFKSRRCLVPATGFFEWVKTAGGKQPHYIRFEDNRPFALAGLWENWSRGNAGNLETFTIITTNPNDLIAPLHDRMPVVLPPSAYSEWLEPAPLQEAKVLEFFAPYPSEGMEEFPVSKHVNKRTNDDPVCVEPI